MALSHSPKIVTDGLVLCLDAANVKSYPGSGTTWYDISGNGNDVSLINGPVFSSNNGGYFSFDGVNDYCRTVNFLNLSNTNAVTIIYNLKVLNYGSSVKILHELSPNFNSNPGTFVASFSDNSVSQNFQVFASIRGNVGYNIAVYDKSILNDSEWHNHCVIHDTSQTSKENLIYSDASIKQELFNPIGNYGNNNTANFLGSTYLYLCSRAGTSYFSNIQIGSIIMYNRALSQEEIEQNFQALRGRYGI